MQDPSLIVERIGPGASLQDLGRPAQASIGLSRGGAADRVALLEAAALLGSPAVSPAIELVGGGASFKVTAPMVIALTGAEMSAKIGTRSLQWNACHPVTAGDIITIGAAQKGVYGYLTLSRSFLEAPILNSRSAHITAGIGSWIKTGDQFALGTDKVDANRQYALPSIDRFGGGNIRYLAGPQTDLFSDKTLKTFHDTEFTISHSANRQGVRLDFQGDPFTCEGSDSLVSDVIVAGDIQMTGAGQPYVLLSECQTIGGYPRIGTIFEADLPRLAQARSGDKIRFEPIDFETADMLWQIETAQLMALRKQAQPLIRDPHTIADLLSYQLISGMTAGDDV